MNHRSITPAQPDTDAPREEPCPCERHILALSTGDIRQIIRQIVEANKPRLLELSTKHQVGLVLTEKRFFVKSAILARELDKMSGLIVCRVSVEYVAHWFLHIPDGRRASLVHVLDPDDLLAALDDFRDGCLEDFSAHLITLAGSDHDPARLAVLVGETFGKLVVTEDMKEAGDLLEFCLSLSGLMTKQYVAELSKLTKREAGPL